MLQNADILESLISHSVVDINIGVNRIFIIIAYSIHSPITSIRDLVLKSFALDYRPILRSDFKKLIKVHK